MVIFLLLEGCLFVVGYFNGVCCLIFVRCCLLLQIEREREKRSDSHIQTKMKYIVYIEGAEFYIRD